MIILTFYNLPIKLGGHFNYATAVYDAVINSIMFSFVIYLTLVISHAFTAPKYLTKTQFYKPKLIVTALVWASLLVCLLADQLNWLSYVKSKFEYNTSAQKFVTLSLFAFSIMFLGYLVLQTYYLYLVCKTQPISLNNSKSTEQLSVLICFSLATVLIVAYPAANRTV